MPVLTRTLILNILIKHETLTVEGIAKHIDKRMAPNLQHLNFLLDELTGIGFLKMLNGILPPTYTITSDGIAEGERLIEHPEQPNHASKMDD